MNRSGLFLSLLFISVTFFLPPDHLPASSLRASEPSHSPIGLRQQPVPNDLADILPPVPLDVNSDQSSPALLWGSLLVAVGILTLTLLLLSRQNGYGRASTHDPATKALSALDRQEQLLQDKEPVRSAETVAALLREYIGHRYTVNGSSLTTAEASRLLQETPLPTAGIEQERLLTILKRCDHIKFGGFVSDEKTVSELFNTARMVLRSTRRTPS